MYTEEYENKGFPIKGFLMKLILVVITIILLVWLLPKFITPSIGVTKETKCDGSASCDLSGVNALTSQIFADNLDRMKNAAILYYTEERLPKNIGESEEMTLSDMIGKKLIIALIDKNNKAVDVENSYVKITKASDEYILKVNIKDSEKEDYILVHIGCYAYCESYVCEKTPTEVPIKGTKPSPSYSPSPLPSPSPSPQTPKCVYSNGRYYDANGNIVSEVNYIISCQAPKCQIVNGYYFGVNGNNVSKSTYEAECSTPTPTRKCVYYNGNYYDADGNIVSEVNYIISCQAPKCQIVNGYYFGKNGNNVNKSTYEAECSTPTPTRKCVYYNGNYYDADGNIVSEVNYIISCQAPKCQIVNGYYFGKNGNHVNKSTYEAECTTPAPTPKCVYYNGNYYDANGKVVSEVNYIISCQAPKCQIVNGYYFGKNGNNVNKSTYEKECTTPTPEYEYEYQKVTNATLSAWTPWSSWTKTSCSTKEVNCNDNSISCLYKLQMLTRKEKIGSYQKTYARTREMIKQTGSYTQKSCANYNYVEINKTLYATTTTTTYTTINNITTTTKQSTGGWTYNGRASYSNPPRDTAGQHYKFVGADYSYCSETCSTLPNYYYDSYTYSPGLKSVSSTTTPGGTTTSSSSSTSSSTSTSYEASCGQIVSKTIPIYGTITVTEKASRTEPMYGDVCYQSTKTRTVTNPGSTQKKWSTYNDTTLLNNGWTYTGNRRTK